MLFREPPLGMRVSGRRGGNEATRPALHVRADPVVQPRRTSLGAVGLDWNPSRVLRVVDIDVELVEGSLQFRTGSRRTNLWADCAPLAVSADDEVLVWRDIGHARIG